MISISYSAMIASIVVLLRPLPPTASASSSSSSRSVAAAPDFLSFAISAFCVLTYASKFLTVLLVLGGLRQELWPSPWLWALLLQALPNHQNAQLSWAWWWHTLGSVLEQRFHTSSRPRRGRRQACSLSTQGICNPSDVG